MPSCLYSAVNSARVKERRVIRTIYYHHYYHSDVSQADTRGAPLMTCTPTTTLYPSHPRRQTASLFRSPPASLKYFCPPQLRRTWAVSPSRARAHREATVRSPSCSDVTDPVSSYAFSLSTPPTPCSTK